AHPTIRSLPTRRSSDLAVRVLLQSNGGAQWWRNRAAHVLPRAQRGGLVRNRHEHDRPCAGHRAKHVSGFILHPSPIPRDEHANRSEEHTSELQSRENLV